MDHDAHRQTKESQENGANDRLHAAASGKENGSCSGALVGVKESEELRVYADRI